jgi:hypothetical protein
VERNALFMEKHRELAVSPIEGGELEIDRADG